MEWGGGVIKIVLPPLNFPSPTFQGFWTFKTSHNFNSYNVQISVIKRVFNFFILLSLFNYGIHKMESLQFKLLSLCKKNILKLAIFKQKPFLKKN